MKDAVLLGPFIGEFYWEAGRFAPILPQLISRKYVNRPITYIVYTRPERFDLYGKRADIFVPLRIEGDYTTFLPECYRLIKYSERNYQQLIDVFKDKYSKQYNIVEHIYPDISKSCYCKKDQYKKMDMIFDYSPRRENYNLVEEYLPKNDKFNVIISSRFRDGFRRNWNKWPEFFNLVYNDPFMMRNFNFIVCGKPGEYIPDPKHRFYDMNDIKLGSNSSLAGLLLVILEKSIFTIGSQSAIPNISLLKGVDVLEFGCQKLVHTRTYNPRNTPITFIENMLYNIDPRELFDEFKKLLKEKKGKLKNEEQ